VRQPFFALWWEAQCYQFAGTNLWCVGRGIDRAILNSNLIYHTSGTPMQLKNERKPSDGTVKTVPYIHGISAMQTFSWGRPRAGIEMRPYWYALGAA